MEKVFTKKAIIGTVILIVVSLVSIFGVSPIVRKPEFHKNSLEVLEEKERNVTIITASAIAASVGLAAIPGDVTTPIANEILDLTSKLAIVIGAIFLEKILLSLTGYLTFSFLIPISCALFAVYLFTKKDALKRLSLKLVAFGLIIFMVVPISVTVSNLIEKANETEFNSFIQEANDLGSETVEEDTSEEESSSGWSAFTSKVKDVGSTISNGATKALEKGKKALTDFIDNIAVLIITSCVIPIIVLFGFVWIVKIIFNVTIPVPNIATVPSTGTMVNFFGKGKKNDKENTDSKDNEKGDSK